MRAFRFLVPAAAVGCLLLACAKQTPPAATSTSTGGGGLPPGKVVATFNGGQITAEEMETAVKPKIKELENQMFQARKQGLEQLAMEKIVKAEAAKQNISDQEFIRKKVEALPVAQPTDEQQHQFFDRLKAGGQIPPETKFDDIKDRIAQAMVGQQRQSQVQTVIAELQKQANLKMDLPQPRVEVAAAGPSRGPKDAKVTIVEFSDFECPYCGAAHDTVEKVMTDYAGKVRLVYRQFPLSFHPHAGKAAEASLCALDQNKFWEFHDVLFKNQKKLAPDDLKAHAGSVGLDGPKFSACLESGQKKAAVDADEKDGAAAGVGGTPAFFINGIFLNGALPIEEFKKVIDSELASR